MTLNTDKNSLPEVIDNSWREFLGFHDGSLLLSKRNAASKIVVGVPHHGPRSYSRMLCDRSADENAGYIGCYLAEILPASLIVANRYFFDPNKSESSDYFKFIKAGLPNLLIEIHGHGARNAVYDIEISSGPEDEDYAKAFSQSLSHKMKKSPDLKKFSISGNYNKIYFTAQYSCTVTDSRWHTLHIELPPALRKQPDSPYPPAAGFHLMDMIAELINSQE
ncbi:MAG: hypothetical protein K9N06_06415 [Candidatus Cloacimonetes bacterium]|nr:hypothetical protein [Candidatus Cloacimonadota bacterium]